MREFDDAQFNDLREKYDKLNEVTAPNEVKVKVLQSITTAESKTASRNQSWIPKILGRREQVMSAAAALGAVVAVFVIVVSLQSHSSAHPSFTAGTTPRVKFSVGLMPSSMPLSGLDTTVLWLALAFGVATVALAAVYGEERIRVIVSRVIQPISIVFVTCLLGLTTLGTSLYLNHSSHRLLVSDQINAEGYLIGGVNAFVASGLAKGSTQHADAAYWGLGYISAAANGLDTVQGIPGLEQFLEQATRNILGKDPTDAATKAHDERVIAVLQQSFTPLWLSHSSAITPQAIQAAVNKVYEAMTPSERRTFEHM